MIKVLIADDHAVVRNGLKLLIGEMGDAIVAGAATNGEEVLKLLQQDQYDLLLLDLTMPGLSGVELIERIHELHTGLPILVLSMRSELLIIKRIINTGVEGYITKGSSEDSLIAAIRKVAAGEQYNDPEIAERLMFETSFQNEDMSIEQLSERELEIMKLLAQGDGLTEIAKKLEISVKTVSTYKTRVMTKMNFKSNSELVIYAAEYGFGSTKK
jgi:DNA-binding NarL/FixJ family response regulator